MENKKFEDITNILQYIPEDNKDFYNQLVEWPIADDAFINDDE